MQSQDPTLPDNATVPVPVARETPRFDIEDEAALQYLEDHGYVVIKGVLTPDEIDRGRSLAWDFIENRPGSMIKRTDPKTWGLDWPDRRNKGILVEDGVGQSEFLWFVRGVPAVQRVYERVWGTSELLTSFDGFCMFRPIEYDPSWKTASGWYHVDQNGFKKPNKLCIQGFVNFYDAGPTDGGLVVVPGSPKIFNKLFVDPSCDPGMDFYRIPPSAWTNEVAGLSALKVCCKAGDMVLWDSRTIHCSAPPSELLPLPEDGSLLPPRRLVAYVCMSPKSRLTPEVAKQREEAFRLGHSSNHWPEECNILGRLNDTARRVHVAPKLTARQRSLVPLPPEDD